MRKPTTRELIHALEAAGKNHRIFEDAYMHGNRDEMWSGFYSAFVLGRCGEFMPADILAEILNNAGKSDDWSAVAAALIQKNIKSDESESYKETCEVFYVCPKCFRVSETMGNCKSCGADVFEFHPGDENDPCRCPVVNENGEVVTHAPLWWLRCVAPEMVNYGMLNKNRNQKEDE